METGEWQVSVLGSSAMMLTEGLTLYTLLDRKSEARYQGVRSLAGKWADADAVADDDTGVLQYI